MGKPSYRFHENISWLVLKEFDVNAMPVYRTLKVGKYFKLISPIFFLLVSDLVCRLTCQCDTVKTYIGMSSRHLAIRAREHLKLDNNRKSATMDHLQQCKSCFKPEINLYSSFRVLKKCLSEYNAKIHKTLLIKQNKPLLNKRLYENRCSFLLKIF